MKKDFFNRGKQFPNDDDFCAVGAADLPDPLFPPKSSRSKSHDEGQRFGINIQSPNTGEKSRNSMKIEDS